MRELRETAPFIAIYLRCYELGCGGGALLLHYRKEGPVVEGQSLTQTPELSTEVIRDVDAFDAIASEWDQLVDRWAPDPMFLSHTWFRTWWEAFGKGSDLHIVIVRSGGHLVAVAPMMQTRTNIYGFKADALCAIYNSHSPRYDFVVANQDPRLYAAIWDELMQTPGADVVILPQMPAESRTIEVLDDLGKQQGWHTGQWLAPVAPVIRLGCEYESFFNTLGSRCRFNLTKRLARLQKRGLVDIELI